MEHPSYPVLFSRGFPHCVGSSLRRCCTQHGYSASWTAVRSTPPCSASTMPTPLRCPPLSPAPASSLVSGLQVPYCSSDAVQNRSWAHTPVGRWRRRCGSWMRRSLRAAPQGSGRPRRRPRRSRAIDGECSVCAHGPSWAGGPSYSPPRTSGWTCARSRWQTTASRWRERRPSRTWGTVGRWVRRGATAAWRTRVWRRCSSRSAACSR